MVLLWYKDSSDKSLFSVIWYGSLNLIIMKSGHHFMDHLIQKCPS